ncbi:hypothetical protein [Nocardioides pakistanensis]
MPRISYVPSVRTLRVAWTVFALVAVTALAGLLWVAVTTSRHLDEADARLDRARAERQELVDTARANADAAAALAEQVRRLGERPVAEPTEVVEPVPGPRGPRGEQGEPGRAPSTAEIRSALAAYCAGGRCDGRSPTTAQVRTAVLTYCDARGQCRGPAGEDGADGQPGAAGADGRDGMDAPPPTQEQVDAAVVSYCNANGGCRGPQGPRGEQGPAGVSAVPFSFTFTVDLNPVQSRTYTCTITDPDQPVTCERVDS